MVLYTIGVNLYYFFIWIASWFNGKARLWVIGRRELPKNHSKLNNVVWFHCSSYGEYEQGAVLIKKFHEKYPANNIILSFFSPSGFEKANVPEFIAYKFYLPRDYSKNFDYLINEFNITQLILIKYELWPKMIKSCLAHNVRVHLVSSRFYKGHIIDKFVGFRNLLKKFNSIHVIDEFSFDLLHAYGFDNLHLSGDTRFDRVEENSKQAYSSSLLKESNKPIIVFGSLWMSDLKNIGGCLSELNQTFRFVLAPHDIIKSNINDIKEFLKEIGIACQLLSEIEEGESSDNLIVDTIGELKFLYRYAKIAYVGGGFDKGLHNILEALVYNVPVIIGPSYNKFPEVVDAVDESVCFPINNDNEFLIQVQLISGEDFEIKIKDYLFNRLGASKKILEIIVS